MDKVIWGIIGCGDVAEIKSGPAFQKLPHSELRAVMRRNLEKAEDFAHRHGVPEFYGDVNKIIQNPQINAVYIATPPSSHLNYAEKSLATGKCVYLEKPMVLNLKEANELQLLVEKYKGKLTVAHYRRQLPAFLKVKELLADREIGDPRIVSISIRQPENPALVAQSETNWRIDPGLSGGGYFYDLAPHQLDLMYTYFGKPIYTSGIGINQSGKYKANDLVQGTILFSNKVVFHGIWSFAVHPQDKLDQCTILGSQGKIEFSFFGDQVRMRKGNNHYVFDFQNPLHIQEPMIRKTIQYFLQKGENPCSVEDAKVSLEMMQAFTSTSI